MKFNFSLKAKSKTVNHEGAKAFTMTPEMELYSAIATTMLSNAFYEKADDRLQRIISLTSKVNPEFAAKLAVYARTRLHLRTAPVILATELAKVHNGDGLVSKTVNGIVQRPDEITELLAYYQMSNKRTETKKLNKISKQVQKGLAMAFNKFDEYQFAKYDRAADVKLRDALFLVHPKAKDDAQQALFNKIAKQELAVPYTWETELSALGQQQFTNATEKQQAFKAKWEELIDSNKLGYMALLRNLRNILEADVSTGHIQKICERLADEHEVAKSKQLPFRFLAAYREIGRIKTGYEGYVMEALEEAIQKSVVNLKGFSLNTRVVIACDVSGSMQRPVSGKSKVLLYDIGLLLGMLLQSKCSNVMTGMFGDIWKKVSLRKKNILANVDDFYKREGEVGYATNGYLVIKNLIDKRYMADKVMIFTDAQLWDSMTGNRNPHYTLQYQWLQYKKIAPKAKLYLFDLAGYGTAPLSLRSDDVYLIAGWSDKVFDVMEALENGAEALQHIHETEL